MNNIINLQDKRQRSIEANYQILSQQARLFFPQLEHFKGQDFESTAWRYRGETLHFSTLKGRSRSEERTPWPMDVEATIKLFIIGHLWDSRTRTNPLSYSRIKPFRDIAPFLIAAGMSRLEDLTYDVYYRAYQAITDYYARPVSTLQDLNSYVNFLQGEYLLPTALDTISPNKNKRVQEKQGPPALMEKMPIPELVRAIIQLKWKVEEAFDQDPNDHRTISDLLCVYTQAFQHGLGLRIGEVLRLPLDCIQEVNGELFCTVWTEKGMTPHARYIPELWRPVLSDIVDRIRAMTRSYRKYAIELEHNKYLPIVRQRFEYFKSERYANAQELIDELEVFLDVKKDEAQKAWRLKQAINPEHEYTLDELNDILPISSTAKATSMRVKAYQGWGLELTIVPIDAKRNRYTVRGREIINLVEILIELRWNSVTQLELTSIIQGRQTKREISRDRILIEKSIEASGGTAACYTFNPSGFKGKGRAPTIISKESAIDILTQYGHGSYDIENHIDILTFQKLFPEIGLGMSDRNKNFKEKNPDLDISNKKKLTVKVKKEGSSLRYSVNEGYTISQASIENYIYKRFTDLNFSLEKELYEADLKDQNEELKEKAKEIGFEAKALTILSKSFSVEQKVSEHLFLRSELSSGVTEPNPLIPAILGYHAVRYFFTGNDRYDSAFIKYKIGAPEHVTKRWQSHKGRHWRTTSLFRAGVVEAIVNRWMGRTELQGRHYDHNTGSERAKMVGELMLKDQNRFLGNIPQKIRQFQHDQIPIADITEYLDTTMQTVQYTPLGYCVRSLNLSPCELNMKCLVGSDGNGCKHFIFDLKDEYQRERLVAERDKTEVELQRLIDVYESGVKAAKMHIDRHLNIYKNANTTLEKADKLLGTSFSETKQEFMPFHENGSYPDDCPFQCGDN